MKLTARTKLVLIIAGFALPIAGSYLAYHFARPAPTANYGELLLPPAHVPGQSFERTTGRKWSFAELRGGWALTMSDSGACQAACVEKLTTLRQVRLALGRNAARVARVYVIDDLAAPDPQILDPFEGTVVALTPRGMQLPSGAANDRAHIYLVDPNGNVMMRWPSGADRKRMLKDLERLLKASQIGHNHGLAKTVPC